ncbi:MAG: DNA/RNA nuclease SfsA [Planctomycetota bacterium]
MQITQPVAIGRFIKRYKRFLTDVELDGGEIVTVHCPNTGSMKGCLVEGARVAIRDSQDPKRKLQHTLQTIEVDGTWVNVDTGLPNALAYEALAAGAIESLAGYDKVRREVKYGTGSRIDVLLENEADGARAYVEVKNTTLVEGDVAKFPDAVTTRGLKHLEELGRVVEEGHRGVMLYCVSRSDAKSFAPADEIDPDYGKALRRVAAAGVELLAYTTKVTPTSFEFGDALPIEL